jgi:hypothetical protein
MKNKWKTSIVHSVRSYPFNFAHLTNSYFYLLVRKIENKRRKPLIDVCNRLIQYSHLQINILSQMKFLPELKCVIKKYTLYRSINVKLSLFLFKHTMKTLGARW